MVRALLIVLPLLLAGCRLANRPPDQDPRHLEIRWRTDFATACKDAQATSKPILLVGASGDLTGEC